MAVEAKRGCGFRKVGGLYLCGPGAGLPCDRLPFFLDICPTCSHGIKQSRGWTWIDVKGLFVGPHGVCECGSDCPLCAHPETLGRAGLLWIGERFYETPDKFLQEAVQFGISKRIHSIPRGFELGETWVLLGHPKAVKCFGCDWAGSFGPLDLPSECLRCEGSGTLPGIFRVFRPTRLELIITETQSKDSELLESLQKRRITPIIVPDNDSDHLGSVFDKKETNEIRF